MNYEGSIYFWFDKTISSNVSRNRINPFLRDCEQSQLEGKQENGQILDPLGAIPVQNHIMSSSQSKSSSDVSQINGEGAHDHNTGML